MNTQMPFQQLLNLVKFLTPSQKATLKKELDKTAQTVVKEQNDFMEFLLQGPVYAEGDIAVIEENRKSIAAWRTKS